MSFLTRRLSFGSMKSNSSAGSRPPVPESQCKLNLDGNTLILNEKGQWKLDKSTVGNYELEIQRLHEYIEQLEEENREIREHYRQANGERMMSEFKNELLMEMLAVSQLDATRNNEEFQKESLKVEALKWELGKWKIAQNEI